ncbi:MAG: hypothetical protein ACRD63_16235, partial [Pyrinomonadaceae bacterium]
AVSRGTPQESSEVKRDVSLIVTDEGMAGPLRAFVDAIENIRAKSAPGVNNNATHQNKVDLTGQGLRLRTPHPGATVFAVHDKSSQKVDSNRAPSAPSIIGQSVGRGSVLVVAPADTWRIKFDYSTPGDKEEKDDPYNTLWQGLALWASANAMPANEIVISDESPLTGSEVTVELTSNDLRTFKPQSIDQVHAMLNQISDQTDDAPDDAPDDAQSKTTANIPLTPVQSNHYIWHGKFIPPQSGRYTIVAKFSAGGKNLLIQKMMGISPAPKNQSVSGIAIDTLRRAARETGGDLYDESQLEELVGSLIKHIDTTSKREYEILLRTWWPLAIIIPSILSLEWWLRRRWLMD